MISKKDFYSILQEVDSIANKYNPGCNNYFNSKLFTEGLRRDFNTVLRYLNNDNGKKMLDFGCGTGYFSVLLSKFFKEVYGVDINLQTNKIGGLSDREMMRLDLLNRHIWREYSKKYQITFNDYDGKKLPYPNDYFDGIVSYGVIEHIADGLLDNIIEELFRVLRKEGILFIFKTPRSQSYTEKIFHSHKKLMNEKELLTLLETHGFQISKFYRTDILPEFYPFRLQKIVNFLTPVIFPIQNLLDNSPINLICHNLVIIAKK